VNKKQYKAMTFNRKMRIQNKMNQLRTRADICMAEIRRNTKEREKCRVSKVVPESRE
jgi:hypothetical protein